MKSFVVFTLVAFIIISGNVFSQETDINALELKFNKHLWQLGYQVNLTFSISRDTVYERLVEWFDSQAVTLRLKLDYKHSVPMPSMDCDTVDPSKSTDRNKPYRIEGRYFDFYKNKKFIGNRGFHMCSKMKLMVYPDSSLNLTITNFKLPYEGWMPLEKVVLRDDLEFARAYRKLEAEMNNKTAALIEDMLGWIDNYHFRKNINKQFKPRNEFEEFQD